MNKIIKITMILLILILIFGIQFQMNISYATPKADPTAPEGAYTDSSSEQKAKEELKKQKEQKSKSTTSGTAWDYGKGDWTPEESGDEPTLVAKTNVILAYIRNIGIIISVIALMVIGFKTIAGSIEEKSQYKQALPVYILGVIMVIAVTVLPSVIYDMVTQIKY